MTAARERIEQVLREYGISEQAPSDLHSWRCQYPDMYGACSCFSELVVDLVDAINGRASNGMD